MLGVSAARAAAIAAEYPLGAVPVADRRPQHAGLRRELRVPGAAGRPLDVRGACRRSPTSSTTTPRRSSSRRPGICRRSRRTRPRSSTSSTSRTRPSPRTLDADQEALAASMRAAWANFAATAIPSSAAVPWPSFDDRTGRAVARAAAAAGRDRLRRDATTARSGRPDDAGAATQRMHMAPIRLTRRRGAGRALRRWLDHPAGAGGQVPGPPDRSTAVLTGSAKMSGRGSGFVTSLRPIAASGSDFSGRLHVWSPPTPEPEPRPRAPWPSGRPSDRRTTYKARSGGARRSGRGAVTRAECPPVSVTGAKRRHLEQPEPMPGSPSPKRRRSSELPGSGDPRRRRKMGLPHFSYGLNGLIPQAQVRIYPARRKGPFQHHPEFDRDVHAVAGDDQGADQGIPGRDEGRQRQPRAYHAQSREEIS